MIETIDHPADVLFDRDFDNGDDDVFHIEKTPDMSWCGTPLSPDEPERPFVKGVYDCPVCWELYESGGGDDDYEDEPAPNDGLNPARGIFNGMMIGFGFYIAVAGIFLLVHG